MSRGAGELAAGDNAKEGSLLTLFGGASLVRHGGEKVGALDALHGKTVLLYFAAGWAEACKEFSQLLSMFYDTVLATGDDSIAVVLVSRDKSEDQQLEFFDSASGGEHREWMMLEWSHDLGEIGEKFKIETIPSLVVVDRYGEGVVEAAHQQVYDIFEQGGNGANGFSVEQAIAAKWFDWKTRVDTSRSPARAKNPSQHDREALRATRLTVLDRRGNASEWEGGGSMASDSAMPPVAAPAPLAAPEPPGAPSLPSGSQGFEAVGVFSAGDVGSSPEYTLAGATLPTSTSAPADDDLEVISDMAVNESGPASRDELSEGDMDCANIPEDAVAQIVDMGFPKEMALHALQQARGDMNLAMATLVGD